MFFQGTGRQDDTIQWCVMQLSPITLIYSTRPRHLMLFMSTRTLVSVVNLARCRLTCALHPHPPLDIVPFFVYPTVLTIHFLFGQTHMCTLSYMSFHTVRTKRPLHTHLRLSNKKCTGLCSSGHNTTCAFDCDVSSRPVRTAGMVSETYLSCHCCLLRRYTALLTTVTLWYYSQELSPSLNPDKHSECLNLSSNSKNYH